MFTKSSPVLCNSFICRVEVQRTWHIQIPNLVDKHTGFATLSMEFESVANRLNGVSSTSSRVILQTHFKFPKPQVGLSKTYHKWCLLNYDSMGFVARIKCTSMQSKPCWDSCITDKTQFLSADLSWACSRMPVSQSTCQHRVRYKWNDVHDHCCVLQQFAWVTSPDVKMCIGMPSPLIMAPGDVNLTEIILEVTSLHSTSVAAQMRQQAQAVS